MDKLILLLILTGSIGHCASDPVTYDETGGSSGDTGTSATSDGGDGGAAPTTSTSTSSTTTTTSTTSSEAGGSGGSGGATATGPAPGTIGAVCEHVNECGDGLVCLAIETEAMGGTRICTAYCKIENGVPVLDSCGPGLVCLGVPGAPACLLSCAEQSDCPEGFTCNPAFGGFCSP